MSLILHSVILFLDPLNFHALVLKKKIHFINETAKMFHYIRGREDPRIVVAELDRPDALIMQASMEQDLFCMSVVHFDLAVEEADAYQIGVRIEIDAINPFIVMELGGLSPVDIQLENPD